MAERTKYAPGTFSWADLSTTDQDGAKQFYAGLFGWDADDQPVGDGMTYSMMKSAARPSRGSLCRTRCSASTGRRRPGTRTSRSTAPTTPADRASKLGANVIAPAFDVMDVGRMAVIQDPQGAILHGLGAQAAHRRFGRQRATARCPGTSSRARIWTVGRASTASCSDGRPSRSRAWRSRTGSSRTAAAATAECAPSQQTEPTYWLVYFGTDDIDAIAGEVDRARRHHADGRRWTSGSGKIAVFAGSRRAPCSRCSPAISTTDPLTRLTRRR